ncbi:hypothetical protein DIPPA_55091 [Diplonema papillatum]|nr:hypothetical protein DIPPA_55091 [Diplonema papillatum]
MRCYASLADELREFYKWYAPERVFTGGDAWVASFVSCWEDEDRMWAALHQKYGPWPPESSTSPRLVLDRGDDWLPALLRDAAAERTANGFRPVDAMLLRDNAQEQLRACSELTPAGLHPSLGLPHFNPEENFLSSPPKKPRAGAGKLSSKAAEKTQVNTGAHISSKTTQPATLAPPSRHQVDVVQELSNVEDYFIALMESESKDLSLCQFKGEDSFEDRLVTAVLSREEEVEHLRKEIEQCEAAIEAEAEQKREQHKLLAAAKRELKAVEKFTPKFPTRIKLISAELLSNTSEDPTASGLPILHHLLGKKRNERIASVGLDPLAGVSDPNIYLALDVPPRLARDVLKQHCAARREETVLQRKRSRGASVVSEIPPDLMPHTLHSSAARTYTVNDRSETESYSLCVAAVSGLFVTVITVLLEIPVRIPLLFSDGSIPTVPATQWNSKFDAVVSTESCLVRQEKGLESAEVTRLQRGDRVLVEEVCGRRARISKPSIGWISCTNKNGATLISLRLSIQDELRCPGACTKRSPQQTDDQKRPLEPPVARAIVTAPNGVLLREGEGTDTKEAGRAPVGATIILWKKVGRRAKIQVLDELPASSAKPHRYVTANLTGWISVANAEGTALVKITHIPRQRTLELINRMRDGYESGTSQDDRTRQKTWRKRAREKEAKRKLNREKRLMKGAPLPPSMTSDRYKDMEDCSDYASDYESSASSAAASDCDTPSIYHPVYWEPKPGIIDPDQDQAMALLDAPQKATTSTGNPSRFSVTAEEIDSRATTKALGKDGGEQKLQYKKIQLLRYKKGVPCWTGGTLGTISEVAGEMFEAKADRKDGFLPLQPKIFFHPANSYLVPVSCANSNNGERRCVLITPSHPSILYLLWPAMQAPPSWLLNKKPKASAIPRFTKLPQYEIPFTTSSSSGKGASDTFFEVYKYNAVLEAKMQFALPGPGSGLLGPDTTGDTKPYSIVICKKHTLVVHKEEDSSSVLDPVTPFQDNMPELEPKGMHPGSRVAVKNESWHTGTVISQINSKEDILQGLLWVALDRNKPGATVPLHPYPKEVLCPWFSQKQVVCLAGPAAKINQKKNELASIVTEGFKASPAPVDFLLYTLCGKGSGILPLGWGRVCVTPGMLVNGETCKLRTRVRAIPPDVPYAGDRSLSQKAKAEQKAKEEAYLAKSNTKLSTVRTQAQGSRKVVDKPGDGVVLMQVVVRRGVKIKTDKVAALPSGTQVVVAEIKNRRARITAPCEGWISISDINGRVVVAQVSGVDKGSEVNTEAERFKRLQQRLALKTAQTDRRKAFTEQRKIDYCKQLVSRRLAEPPVVGGLVLELVFTGDGVLQDLPSTYRELLHSKPETHGKEHTNTTDLCQTFPQQLNKPNSTVSTDMGEDNL